MLRGANRPPGCRIPNSIVFPSSHQTTDFCFPLQVSWTSPQMTLAGSVHGGEASSSVVPYSSSRPCPCLASRSPCPRGLSTLGRASRPCFLTGTTRGPSRATGSCGTRWTQRAAQPASSSYEVMHWLCSRFLWEAAAGYQLVGFIIGLWFGLSTFTEEKNTSLLYWDVSP